jgi:DNA polymerase-1
MYEYGRKMENTYDEMAKYIVDNNINLGKEFNPRSVPQIQQVILQLDVLHDRDSMSWTPKTDKKALAKLAVDSNFFKLLSKYRFFSKHKGTYYEPLHDYYTSEESDIAHFLMYQTGAKTGRFSVELAQTFPKPEDNKLAGEKHEVRKAIIPRRGKAFLCKDYEQQEMRLFVHYSNCKRMIDIINQKSGTKGFDIYVETADELFKELFQREKLRKALRFVTKTDALGMIYGMGTNKLIASTTGMLYDKFDRSVVEEIGVTDQWAYESLKKFKELYPVDEFNRECYRELFTTGAMKLEFHSELMDFERSYHIPKGLEYKGGNAKIQGTAAYVIKHAMKRCDARIKRERWEGRVDMVLQVHDELIFEVDNDYNFIREVDKAMGEEMDDLVTFKVPITTSGKWSPISLGDVKEFEE